MLPSWPGPSRKIDFYLNETCAWLNKGSIITKPLSHVNAEVSEVAQGSAATASCSTSRPRCDGPNGHAVRGYGGGGLSHYGGEETGRCFSVTVGPQGTAVGPQGTADGPWGRYCSPGTLRTDGSGGGSPNQKTVGAAVNRQPNSVG